MKKKLYQQMIVAAVCVLVSAGALFGLWWGVQRTQASIGALTEVINASSTYQASEALRERRVEETKQQRADVDAYFADVSALVPFLEQVEGLARIAGVTSKVDSVSEETRPLSDIQSGKDKKATYGVVNVTVSFEGSWTQAYRFLSLIEHIPYASRIERAELSKVEDTSDAEKRAGWKGFVVFTVAKLP